MKLIRKKIRKDKHRIGTRFLLERIRRGCHVLTDFDDNKRKYCYATMNECLDKAKQILRKKFNERNRL